MRPRADVNPTSASIEQAIEQANEQAIEQAIEQAKVMPRMLAAADQRRPPMQAAYVTRPPTSAGVRIDRALTAH